MGDIWLPGLPPAYTDYFACLRAIGPHMPTHNDAVIMAAIAGHESGYDYRVINDTPATGDYSVGLWQINYYASLYASRVQAYGTPRQLIMDGVEGQAIVAADLWHQAGGFSPWEADIVNNAWQQFVGSGPVPQNPGTGSTGGGGGGFTVTLPKLPPAKSEAWHKPIDESAHLIMDAARRLHMLDQWIASHTVNVGK